MKTDEQVIESNDDAEMLRRPHLWPGPSGIVFLKFRADSLTDKSNLSAVAATWHENLGFIHPSQPLRVWLGNVLVPPEDGGRDCLDYGAPEDIIADGWEVD